MRAELIFQVLNKVTGGKPCSTCRSSGGRRLILKTLDLFRAANLFRGYILRVTPIIMYQGGHLTPTPPLTSTLIKSSGKPNKCVLYDVMFI
jgi:hypothetical protein